MIGASALLVIAITIGGTLLITRDNSDAAGTTTKSTPSAGDVASANDTGPVSIITSDPTCAAWQPVSGALAASQSEGWRNRDPAASSSNWSPDQRSQYVAAAAGMTSTADQAVALAKQTPHRTMRELYEQFIAYGRAYANSVASSYTPNDNYLSQVNVNASSAISAICDAISQGSALARASTVGVPPPPSTQDGVDNISSPERFLIKFSPACTDLVLKEASFENDLSEWQQLDAEISASQWTPEQRAVQERAGAVLNRYASTLTGYSQQSDNLVFEDFTLLASLYFRAYANSAATYSVADGYLVIPGFRLGNLVTDACRATVG